jgi:hypothetical protein
LNEAPDCGFFNCGLRIADCGLLFGVHGLTLLWRAARRII